MSDAQQLPLLPAQPHRNHTLFSDHYLEEILRREPLWPAARPRAAALLAFLRDLYAREAAQLSGYSEAQLEDHWIKPLLAHLGHVWETQATVPGLAQGIKKPDYVFFADETARQTAVADQRTGEYARHALAVGEVKAWPVNLSRRTANAPTFDNSNPMFQIDAYLRSTGVRWGIVSNGRHWRLVQRDSSHKLDVYFELDLLDALNTADETHALAVATYFVLFFGQPAFRPDDGTLFLDRVLRGSRDYAVALENDLRDNAYKALEQLITGFFAPPKNQLDANDPADRDAVYRHSLLLLYRLLFLFYGESRGLLPLRNPAYAERSLSALARGAALRVDNHTVDALPATAGGLWGQLDELFTVINGDDPDLNADLGVPRYNGGLFDPQRHPFLAGHFVGQRHLVRALDYLARRRKTDNGRDLGYEAVDYRTLGIRQLGSIYEGLLEYKVSLAAEPMVTVRKGGKETWLPARERGKAKSIETRRPGELYLATDKGERKATGSYYTPDAIVKYIVEQTLGPLVEQAKINAKTPRGQDAKEESALASSRPGDFALTSSSEAERFAAEVLALNVLDPAMGSGHFLVEATNFLARALATAEWTTADDRPLTAAEDDAGGRRSAVGGRSDESDLTYWRRRVVEACIYGVDKNELAVELAKLSLWLETAAADKPLSFLDHHLRHGDSLIGAWLRDLDAAPRPVRSPRPDRSVETDPLFDESAFTLNAGQAVGGAAAIEALLTEDLEAVHAKERLFRDFHDNTLGRWRRLADLWVSAYFGNTMSAAEYADLARRIQGRPAMMSDEQAAPYLTHPAVVANDYFHWELEFPEVFFDGYGRPKGAGAGFDAVIGNPPYDVMQKDIGEDRTDQLDWMIKYLTAMSHYQPAIGGKFNIFRFFTALWVLLLHRAGNYGLIIPLSIATDLGCRGLRSFLMERTNLHTIEAFPDRYDSHERVFAEAKTSVAILLGTSKTQRDGVTQINVHTGSDLSTVKSVGYATVEQIKRIDPIGLSLPLSSASLWTILDRVHQESAYLKDVANVGGGEIHLTYYKPYFRDSDRFREVFRGAEIGRYEIYPELSQGTKLYLDLESAIDNGLNPTIFASPRIALQRLTGTEDRYRLLGTIIPAETHLAHTVQYVAEKDEGSYSVHFLLALLCSRFLDARFRVTSGTTNVGVYELEHLPVPVVRSSSDASLRHTRAQELMSLQVIGNHVRVLNEVRSELAEGRTDTIHDYLAYLASDMLSMHKEVQSHTTDFWTDLEGVTDPTTFRKLRDKGKQAAGLAADPALAPFVSAASKSSRSLDESLAWDEAAFKGFVRALAGPVDKLSALLRVYERYAPAYRDLTERLARTDWLIDQIVYQLYGLTAEEIAIVEGRTRGKDEG